MITKELVQYIESERKAGVSDLQIRQNLKIGAGWNDADIDEAMKSAGSATPVPSPDLAQSVQPIPTTFQNSEPASNSVIYEQPKSGGKKAITTILVLLIILGLAAGAYAFKGTILSSFMGSETPYSEGELFKGILAKAVNVETLNYDVLASLKAVPKEADAKPITQFIKNSTISETLNSIPEGFSFEVKASGTYAKPKQGVSSDAHFVFSMNGALNA